MKSRTLRVEVLETRDVCVADIDRDTYLAALLHLQEQLSQGAKNNQNELADVARIQQSLAADIAKTTALGAQMAANHPQDAAAINKLVGQAAQSTANANAMVAKIQAKQSIDYAKTNQQLVMVATGPGDNKIQRLDSIGKNFLAVVIV